MKKDALGDWCITITTDYEGLEPEPKTGGAAGFDYGNKTFLTCSDGTKYESPEFYKQSANAVRKANRQLSRKVRGSNNRKRASQHYARTHQILRLETHALANQRYECLMAFPGG